MESIDRIPPSKYRVDDDVDVGTVAGLVCVLGSVGGRSKLGEGFDGAVGKAGEEFGEVAADGDIEPAAAFDDREDSGDLGAGLLTTEVQPVFLPIAIPQTFCPCR